MQATNQDSNSSRIKIEKKIAAGSVELEHWKRKKEAYQLVVEDMKEEETMQIWKNIMIGKLKHFAASS